MESKLNTTEFRNKLKSVTKIGHPRLKLSPFAMFSMFGDSSKTFYGLYDDSTFSLTSNFRTNATPYILRGSYKTENGKLQIHYKIVPRHKYQLYWWIFVLVLGFSVFNSFIIQSKNNESISTNFYIMNTFLIFMAIYAYLDITRKKRKLERNFVEIFEVTK
jgi:hypothetical protein